MRRRPDFSGRHLKRTDCRPSAAMSDQQPVEQRETIMVRPRSNALAPGRPRLPHWFDPNYVLNIANAGPYHHDPSGYKVFNGTRHQATEGWKFHVSAHAYNAEALAGVLLPLLTNMNVYHKYLELNVLRTRAGVETGK